MFVHLHGHSTYSLLEGIGSIKNMVGRIAELGMKTVALTDYSGVYGAIDFYRTAKDAGLTPIIGVELAYVPSLSVHSHPEQGNIVLLACNDAGYKNLLILISKAHESHVNNKPTIDHAVLSQNNDGLLCLIGGMPSIVGYACKNNSSADEIRVLLESFVSIFGVRRLFAQIQVQDYAIEPFAKKVNDMVLDLSQKMNISCVATNDFHYVKKDDKPAFELALAIKDGRQIYDEERRKVVGDYHIFSEQEMRDMLLKNGFLETSIDELIRNTALVAEQCQLKLDLYQSLFPHYESPETIKRLYDDYAQSLVETI